MVGTVARMASTDEFRWLEDVEGDDALAWVRERNARAEVQLFAANEFEWLRTATLDILEADDRIAYPSRHGDVVHNFWTDSEHRRGLLRRTTWDEYRAGDPAWETILDIDALCEEEGESWVFHGSSTRRPDRRRALIELSPGGSDASVTREFDLVEKRFVPESEGGFVRPLAKGGLTWIDDDTVYVTSDFGPGSLTRSGYPRTVRRWRRGTPIEDAEIVFEGDESDVAVGVSVSTMVGFEHHVFERAPDFFTTRTSLLRGDELVAVDVPDDASVRFHERWVFVTPRSDLDHAGTTHPVRLAARGRHRRLPRRDVVADGAVHADRHRVAGRLHVYPQPSGDRCARRRAQRVVGGDPAGHRRRDVDRCTARRRPRRVDAVRERRRR